MTSNNSGQYSVTIFLNFAMKVTMFITARPVTCESTLYTGKAVIDGIVNFKLTIIILFDILTVS